MPGATNLQQLRAALGGLNNLTDEQILRFVAQANGVNPDTDPRYRAMADQFAGYNRTGTEKVTDTVRGLVSGTIGIGKDAAILGGMVIPSVKTFDNPVYNTLAGMQESIARDQSPGLQAQRAAEQQVSDIAVRRAAAEGAGPVGKIVAGLKAQGANYLRDPALAAQDVIENAPQLLTSGLIGRAAEGVATAAKLGVGATKAVAVGTGVAGNAALQGADTASQTFQQTQDSGANYDQASAAATRAGLKSTLVSAGLSALPGATSIERSLLRDAGSRAGSRIVGAVRGVAGEGVSEAGDEGYAQYAQNQEARQFDPSIDPFAGVGQAAAKGALAAAPLGGVGGFREAGHRQVAQPRTATGEIDLTQAGTSLGAAPPRRAINTDTASQISVPPLTTSPGAAPPRPGNAVDFTRSVDTGELSLIDPAAEARARAATIDFAPADTTPGFTATPGAANPAAPNGVDFTRSVDTSRLTLADPAAEARARAATIDFTPADTTPALTTSPGASDTSVPGVSLPPRQIDTSNLSLLPKGAESVASRPNVSQLVTALQKASTEVGARVVRKDGEVAQTAAAAPLREVVQAADPLQKMRDLYQDGKAPRDELLDLWHKNLTGQTISDFKEAQQRTAPATNSAGFVSEPVAQVKAQLQALRQGRIDTVVLGQEDAAKVDLKGLKTGVATGPDGASAVVVSRDAKKIQQAVQRAKEVGLKQALGEAKGMANPSLTSSVTPPTEPVAAVQHIDNQTGQPIHEEVVTRQDLPNVKTIPDTTTRVVPIEQAMAERQAASADERKSARKQRRDATKALIQEADQTRYVPEKKRDHMKALYELYKRSFAGDDVAAFNYLDRNGYFELESKMTPEMRADVEEMKTRFALERGQERGQKFGATKATLSVTPDAQRSVSVAAERLQGDAKNAIEYLAKNARDPLDREVASRIAPYLEGVRVVVATPGRELPAQVRQMFEGTGTAGGVRGQARGVTAYDPDTHEATVFLAPEIGTKEDVALHELIHAATMRAIDDPRNAGVRADLEQTRQVIQRALAAEKVNGTISGNPARREFGKFFATVVNDPHELLAYAFSSPTFRDFLRGLDSNGSPLPRTQAKYRQVMPNLLQRIVNAVRRLFGLQEAYRPYMEKIADGGQVYTEPGQQTMFQRLDQLLARTLAGPTYNSPARTVPNMESVESQPLRGVADAAKAVTATIRAQAQGHEINEPLLHMLTLRQIEEQYGSKLPAFKDWTGAIFERSSKAAKMAAEADRLAQRWQEIKPTEQRQLAEILLRASNSELKLDDTSPEYLAELSPADRTEHAALRAKLHLLSPEAQAIRKEALAILARQWDNTRAALEKFISLTVPDPGLREKRLADMRQEFGRNHGDYFPLSRFGDEIVIARGAAADGRDIVTFHESTHAADQEVERLKAAGAKQIVRTKATATDARKVASSGFIREMHQLIDANAGGEEAATLHEALQQLYLKSLPELSGAKHMIRRENIEGYSNDALRVFADAVSRGARYASHLEFGPDVHAAMEAAEMQSRSTDKRTAAVVIGRKEGKDPVVKLTQSGTDRLNAVEAMEKDGYEVKFFDTTPDSVVERLAGELEDASPEQLAKWATDFKKLLAKSDDGVEDLRAAKQLYNYMIRSQQVALAPAKGFIGEKGVEIAGQLGYAWYLGFSPAFWAMNTLQNPMIGIPHLGAKYGITKSSGELLNAAKWFATVRLNKLVADRSTPFSVEYLRDQVAKGEVKGLSKLELDMLQRLEDRQVLDFTQAMDLSRIATASSSKWYKAMRIAAAGAHHTEVFNRVTFALAAYRLALKSGTDVSHEDAVKAAEHDVAAVHFDYSYANKPLWMGKSIPAMRLIFMFQQYRQHVLYWWANTVKEAIKGETPEERGRARKAALLMATTQGLFAGALGLPFMGAVATVANMLGGGGPGEEPFDFERWLREAAVGVTGSEHGADLLTRGIFATLGADVTKRIGQADILPLLNPGSARYEKDFDDKTRAYIFDMLGPLGSMALGAARAVDAFNQGDTTKGIAAVAPKFLGDLVRAYDQQVNGLKDKRGEFLARAEAFDGADWAMQALGITPLSATNVRESRGAVLDMAAQLKDDSQRLTTNFMQAWMRNDTKGMTEALADIQQYNSNVLKRGLRNAAITGATLKSAIMSQQRKQLLLAATGGLADTRNQLLLAARVSGMYDLGGRDSLVEAIGKQYGLPGLPGLPGTE